MNVTVPQLTVVKFSNTSAITHDIVPPDTGVHPIIAPLVNHSIVHHAKSYHDCSGFSIVHGLSYVNPVDSVVPCPSS